MIHSMTGFARAQAEGDWGALAWELRSVNHRYLDISLRLPEELRQLEAGFRRQISAVLCRGKVDGTLKLRPGDAFSGLLIDRVRLAALAKAVGEAAAAAPDAGPTDPLRLLAWPGVILESGVDADAAGPAARDALDAALADLQAGRVAEGERLVQTLIERARAIAALAARVRDRLPQVRSAAMQVLRARAAEIGLGVDPERLEQALVAALQRMDVDEELERLGSHIAAFDDAVGRGEPVGRRLDFLMQEFNREANTLASKSQDAVVTHCALEMKVLIEQMREQVQNLE